MKVIVVGVFFAILAGVLVDARVVGGNSTDASATVPESRGDTSVQLRNIHIDIQPIERFFSWMFEDKSVSSAGEQRTFARIRFMGKLLNLVMFLLGVLITMSAGGIMLGIWSVKLGMGVLLLNMAVLLIRLLVSRGIGDTTTPTVFPIMPGQGRVNFQVITSQSPQTVLATIPTMGGGASVVPVFAARMPMGTIVAPTVLTSGSNDRMEYLGNIIGVQQFQPNWANYLNQNAKRRK